MDGYGQSLLGHNFYSFNLLRPSYHQDQPCKLDSSFDDGFGFDPSPTEQIMLHQYPHTANLLSAEAYRLPGQLSPPCVLQRSNDQTQAPSGQHDSQCVLASISGAIPATVESHYERKSEVETRPIDGSMTKRRRDEDLATEPSFSAKSSKNFMSTGGRGGRQSSGGIQASRGPSGMDKRKQLSLEKNRVAASKCRTKKKEKNEQMLEDSRTKAKENKVLRELVGTMETELHTLTTVLSAHSDSLNCKKPVQLKEALRMFQRGDADKRYSDLGDGTSGSDSPALSFCGNSTSSDSYDRSPATPSPSTMQTPTVDSYILEDMFVDSPPHGKDSKDLDDIIADIRRSARAAAAEGHA